MDVRIGQRAQVVIPAMVRRKLGLQVGDRLHLSIDERGRIVLEVIPSDPLERLRVAGHGLWEGIDPVEAQRAARDEWGR